MMEAEKCILWPGWETVRLIGQGSFGAVYEIERDVLGEKEKAALKVISIPQSSGDVEEMVSDGYDSESITDTFNSQLKSIVNEYSLMRKMNGSANVVNCDDVRYIQHENGFGWDIFIKMELLTPLTKALPEKVDEDTVIKIGSDLCKALVLCRKYDIVHRDIKPQNIFVSDNEDYKLGDFGIAKTVEKTSGGTKIGTYKYMAPEVYNNQRYGSSVDIYSLGLVLYWLLNERRMPFMPLPPEKPKAGDEEAARLRRFQGEAIPAPKNGSKDLKHIVLKACAYDPKDRYASAAEMLADLESLQKGEAIVEETDKTEGIWGLGLKKETDTQPGTETEEGTIGIWGQGKKIIEDNPPIEHSGNNPPEKIPDPNPEPPVYEPIEVKEYPQIKREKPSSAKKEEKKPIWLKMLPLLAIVALAIVILCVLILPCKHEWKAATCSSPEVCSKCGKTRGEAMNHSWNEATCTEPRMCVICGEAEGKALGHQWNEATCTEPRTCTVCGSTEGEALGHDWIAATVDAPETCAVCGETRGSAITQPMDLTYFAFSGKSGKFYIHSTREPTVIFNSDWNDLTTFGYCDSAVDSQENIYRNGFHLDGPEAGPYYVEYDIGGEYTRLAGTVAASYDCVNNEYAMGYQKCVEIYCDGYLAYRSKMMSVYSSPEKFDIDVTGVNTIQIKYGTTDGSNDLATIFDAMLS